MKVIAEVGSNWKDLADCLSSIRKAKAAGADAVKFQLFNQTELYGKSAHRGQSLGSPYLPPEWIEHLWNCARLWNIEFMCTAFSPSGYEIVNQYVACHKIASSEITDLDILEKVNSFKKPVLLSTGGATALEIETALAALPDCKVTILYCVAEYPARIVDFRHLEALKERYGTTRYAYGYSDHSCDVLGIPGCARSLGSVVLEKHVNFTDHADTPDAPHSLSTHEFALMVSHLRDELPLAHTFRPNPAKRRLITLPTGERGFYRPLAQGNG